MMRTAISPRLAMRTLAIAGMGFSLASAGPILLTTLDKKSADVWLRPHETESARRPQFGPHDAELAGQRPQRGQRHSDHRGGVPLDAGDEGAAEAVDRECAGDEQWFPAGHVG